MPATRLMSCDELEDIAYNPFAEDNDYISESHQFSSSSVPKLSRPQPALSLNEQNFVKGTPGDGGKHSRSILEISIPPHDAAVHPLKSALAAQNDAVLYDLGVTRPHLSRIISEGTFINVKSSELDNSLKIRTPLASDEETEVIVHEVSPLKIFTFFFFTDVFDISGYFKGLFGWCIIEIWNLSGEPSKGKPALGDQFNSSSRCAIHSCRAGPSSSRIHARIAAYFFHSRISGTWGFYLRTPNSHFTVPTRKH